MAGVIAAASRADAGAFLARLLRLDPEAAVRLRPARAGLVGAWARLPFGVLVTRGLRASVGRDVTVRAKDLLLAVEADGALPEPADDTWRWALPAGPGRIVELLPAEEVRKVAAAAAAAAREALGSGVAGRAVGSRRVRDALLDHVPIVVDAAEERVEVPQRLVQGVVRMGFIGMESVTVCRVGSWTGLAGEFGTAWYRPTGETLTLQVPTSRPGG